MDFWNSVVALPLDQSGPMLAHMPVGLAIVIAALPIAAALLSKRLIFLFGIVALLGVAMSVLLAPAAAPGVTAIAAYLTCLLLACQSIKDWRGVRAESAELAELRAEITKIQDAEARRFVMNLNSKKPTEDDAPLISSRYETAAE